MGAWRKAVYCSSHNFTCPPYCKACTNYAYYLRGHNVGMISFDELQVIVFLLMQCECMAEGGLCKVAKRLVNAEGIYV